MKKIAVPVMALMLTVLASAAVAGDNLESQAGRLFLFQKCVDPATMSDVLTEDQLAIFDPSTGCPYEEFLGPWPMLPQTGRWGQMKYNLLGPEFQFSFQGKNLGLIDGLPTPYTLIYYPDPYPGEGLVCLGHGMANAGGNLQIHGKKQFLVEDVPMGLPLPYDGNYTPASDAGSGAVGAKIWLVPSTDVVCEIDLTDADKEAGVMPHLVWTKPELYLFEGNLITYQYVEPVVAEEQVTAEGGQTTQGASSMTPVPQGSSANRGQGLAKGKNK